jgi:hypothetical protein
MTFRAGKSVLSRVNVAIVGGGLTGTTLAAQLLRRAGPSYSVAVVEKTSSVGRGLAYGKQSRSLLLNVRPEYERSVRRPHHFLRWAQSTYDPATAPGSFLPREVYGGYVEQTLHQAVLSGGSQRPEWLTERALTLARTGEGAVEVLSSSSLVLADRVVLALGNFPPAILWLLGMGRTGTAIFAIPGRPRSSRRWRVSTASCWLRPHQCGCSDPTPGSWISGRDPYSFLPWFVTPTAPAHRCGSSLLERIVPQDHARPVAPGARRSATGPEAGCGMAERVRQFETAGGGDLASRPEQEKRRFVRHLRPYWEVHRHRAAPAIAKLMNDERTTQPIQVHAGRITNYDEDERPARVTYRDRTTGREHGLLADRVINCTGPETDCRRLRDPLVSSLLAAGLARPDPLFLGLDVSPDGALTAKARSPNRSTRWGRPARAVCGSPRRFRNCECSPQTGRTSAEHGGQESAASSPESSFLRSRIRTAWYSGQLCSHTARFR